MNLFIITGASRGLGEALKNKILLRKDHVFSIGRTQSDFAVDLSQGFDAHLIFQKINEIYPLKKYASIHLINNAGIVEPIGPLESIDSGAIEKNIHINLNAAILLTVEFLNQTDPLKVPRKVINISSGVAQNPKGYWAIYSAAKAGLEAYSKSLHEERLSDLSLQITIVNPGVMDTDMQKTIRAAAPSQFPGVERFLKLKSTGLLPSAQSIADSIFKKVLEGPIQKELLLFKAQ